MAPPLTGSAHSPLPGSGTVANLYFSRRLRFTETLSNERREKGDNRERGSKKKLDEAQLRNKKQL
jgi:hypothetical protein